MLPAQLTAEDFRLYPPEARQLAVNQLPLLQRLPLALLPLLLRELIQLDWKFPAERRDLQGQFDYLSALRPEELPRAVEPFTKLGLSPALERTDWVNSPATFSEQLTAHLWATHQIDAFHEAATAYMRKASERLQEPTPPTHRLSVAVIGKGSGSDVSLFRKLSPHGVTFTQVEHQNGLRHLMGAVAQRASAHPVPYGHWYIDGGAPVTFSAEGVTQVSYGSLSRARAALQSRMQKTYENGAFDPEAFRSMLARTRLEDLGFAAEAGADVVLNRFQLSVLTEGSGTQVFATTFVQWTAREALRRAQPLTLLARFAPRQREKPMNELLTEAQGKPELDPDGSLIDADLGAYYTWINQQRLAGAEKSAFLAWFEDREQAVVIAPSFEKGKRITSAVQLKDLISKLT